MNSHIPFTDYLIAEGLLRGEDVFLVDVGASGGIDPTWLLLESRLRAVGFDPLVNEVKRLNQQNQHQKVEYVDAFVGAPSAADNACPAEVPSRSNESHSRSSSLRAEKLGGMDYRKEQFNSGQEMVLSSRRISVDDYFPGAEGPAIDFIKIDTDGSDYQVLLGAKQVLEAGGALGLSIECQFHGPVHDEANLFCNIDRFLRGRGFSLYDLEVHRYSRAELPRPFVYDIPAQTTHGQVQWGEALYFRDLANADYARMWGREYGASRRLKLAALFELFNLQDCAVELLMRDRAAFESVVPVERCLDLLTPSLNGQRIRYQDHEAAFAYWAGRREWRRFGREPVPPAESARPRAGQVGPGAFDLGQRMARFLGRERPVEPAEFQRAHALLEELLAAPDVLEAIERLQRSGTVPVAFRPVLLYHLGVAYKTSDALLAQVLEAIYGRFKFSDCAFT